MELSPYAEARVALAKFKIIQARYELLRYAREHRTNEWADANIIDLSEDLAAMIIEWERAIDPHAPAIELIATAEFITGVVDGHVGRLAGPVHDVAPGF